MSELKNVFVINAHQEYEFSKGKLNAALTEMALEYLSQGGYQTKLTTMKDEWTVDEEIEKHQWADVILLQTPVNWMGVPWSFKKYMDHVYSFGMDGRLCNGDGRSRSDASRQYGTGGTLAGKKYMMSLTFNAPENSFNDASQVFFGDKSPDDLFWPMHLNFSFFGMEPMDTFACYDVMKNPQIESDFERYRDHLSRFFPAINE